MERVIITTLCYHGTDCRVAAWQSNGKISRICLEDPREERLLGSIHVGKVQKILPDIKGAFVEIENRTSCYFPYTKESNFLYTMPKKAPELRAGDELLVQVTREAIKTKAPCVSSNLNFTGKYLVLTTGNRTLGISAKIPSGKREKLKEFLEELMPEDCSYGISSSNQWCAGFRGRVEGRTAVTGNAVYTAVSESPAHTVLYEAFQRRIDHCIHSERCALERNRKNHHGPEDAV